MRLIHPDKTFVDRIRHGFDILGYRFESDALVDVARQTVERFAARVTWLDEQDTDAV